MPALRPSLSVHAVVCHVLPSCSAARRRHAICHLREPDNHLAERAKHSVATVFTPLASNALHRHQLASPRRTTDAEPRQRTPLVPLSSDSAERSLLHPFFLRDRNTAQSLPAQGGCTFASSAGTFSSRGDSQGCSIFCMKRAQGSSAHKRQRQHVTSEGSEIPPGPTQPAGGGRVDKMLLHAHRYRTAAVSTGDSEPRQLFVVLLRRCVRARYGYFAAVSVEEPESRMRKLPRRIPCGRTQALRRRTPTIGTWASPHGRKRRAWTDGPLRRSWRTRAVQVHAMAWTRTSCPVSLRHYTDMAASIHRAPCLGL